MNRLALALVVAGLLADLLAPTLARAYSDPAMFGAPVDVGGGGGRLFTGSVRDGLSCAVCHTGRPRVPLVIDGLPLSGYVPGASYEVTVAWPEAVTHAGLAMEVTDMDGRGAGTLVVPEGEQLRASELCVPSGGRVPAAFVENTPDERSVVMVADCGARQVRMLWTAPSDSASTVVGISGAFVAGDGSSDVRGDGVTTLSRVLHPAGQPLPSQSRAVCAVTNPGRPGATAASWLLMALALLLLRRVGVRAWPSGDQLQPQPPPLRSKLPCAPSR